VTSLSVAAGGDGVSVVVTVTTYPANTFATLTAVTSYGSYLVRATLPVGASGSLAITDRYAPYGVPITYQLRTYSASPTVQTDSAPFTLTGPGYATLTDTGLGTTVGVIVAAQEDRSYRARSVFYDVIDRSAPVVASQPARLMEGTLRLRMSDVSGKRQVEDMLKLGYPLVLRTPYHSAVEDVTLLQDSWTIGQFREDGGPWEATIRYQAVDAAFIPDLLNSATYATLAVDVRAANYAALTGVWLTYATLALG
jgi:hypothetical protein